MRDILYALRHVRITAHEWKDKGETKRIRNADNQLQRIRQAERDAKVRGVPLSKGGVHVAPHSVAKPDESRSEVARVKSLIVLPIKTEPHWVSHP